MPSSFNYDIGAIIIAVISFGFAIIVYGAGLVPYDLFNLPAWILGPLGVYSLIYAAVASRETFYYFAWGMILLVAAALSALYRLVNVAVVIGIFLVAIGVVAAIAYMREPRNTHRQ